MAADPFNTEDTPLTPLERTLLKLYREVAFDAFWHSYADKKDEETCLSEASGAVFAAMLADANANDRMVEILQEVAALVNLNKIVLHAQS